MLRLSLAVGCSMRNENACFISLCLSEWTVILMYFENFKKSVDIVLERLNFSVFYSLLVYHSYWKWESVCDATRMLATMEYFPEDSVKTIDEDFFLHSDSSCQDPAQPFSLSLQNRHLSEHCVITVFLHWCFLVL